MIEECARAGCLKRSNLSGLAILDGARLNKVRNLTFTETLGFSGGKTSPRSLADVGVAPSALGSNWGIMSPWGMIHGDCVLRHQELV